MQNLRLPALLLALVVPIVGGCGMGSGRPQPTFSSEEGCPACVVPTAAEVIATKPTAAVLVAEPLAVAPEPVAPPAAPTVATQPGTSTEEAVGEFRFAADASAALLKVLPPSVTQAEMIERTLEPRRKGGPAAIEEPTGLDAPALDDVPRLPRLERRGLFEPRITLTESLDGPAARPALPSEVAFVLPPKIKAERPDPAVAADLPLLGQPVPDRASLDDPTRGQSLEAVLTAPVPDRQTPAPFARQAIPDPFENRRAVQFDRPLEEPAQPVPATPKRP